MSDWQINTLDSDRIVTVTIGADDEDEGAFLFLNADDVHMDLITSDVDEVKEFQREVNEACERFFALKGD